MEEQLGQLIEQVLGKWGGQRRESDAIRDDMVRVALWTGISKHRIYVLTGIARTTIDRIAAVTRVPSGSDRELIMKLARQLGSLQDDKEGQNGA
jgi:hypothetical protein